LKDTTADGFHIFKPPSPKIPLKAAYGIYLIKLIEEADKLGEKEERFVEINPCTLEEFKQRRKDVNRRNLFKNEQ